MSDNLPSWGTQLERRVSTLEATVSDMKSDVAEIKGVLSSLATKADIAVSSERLSSKIDNSVNGILDSALKAYPARVGLIWTAVGALAMVAAAVEALAPHIH